MRMMRRLVFWAAVAVGGALLLIICYVALHMAVAVDIATGQSLFPQRFVVWLGYEKYRQLFVELEAAAGPALSARWDTDNTIPTADVGIGWVGEDYWININLSSKASCGNAADSPCERLVHELASIVFDRFKLLDELTGLNFILIDSNGLVLERRLTIPEWRQVLGRQ